MTLPSRVIEVLSLLLAVTMVSTAQEVEFARDVRPIFAEHCAQCHGPDDSNRMADLHLDQPETFRPETFRMAASGYSVIAPGEPEQSELFRRVTSEDELFRMPPALHAPALPPEKIDVIRRWIEQGGEWQPHWAYRPFHEVTPPVVSDEARVRNPIDVSFSRASSVKG